MPVVLQIYTPSNIDAPSCLNNIKINASIPSYVVKQQKIIQISKITLKYCGLVL